MDAVIAFLNDNLTWVLIFFLMQKQFIAGLTLGATKG